ncbi:hypothetical protein [Actinacidiphila rubida]|uniref:hypothetical protein n=1 Tax=Actinacidiphila rubida TaxID=310780 RepID=UPI0015A5B694|nr:hypothetical protein [Actinacidiphila rubida]
MPRRGAAAAFRSFWPAAPRARAGFSPPSSGRAPSAAADALAFAFADLPAPADVPGAESTVFGAAGSAAAPGFADRLRGRRSGGFGAVGSAEGSAGAEEPGRAGGGSSAWSVTGTLPALEVDAARAPREGTRRP